MPTGHLVDFYRPEREAQVLRRRWRAQRKGALRDEEVLRLFREIMSACLAQEEPLKVAFLGPEGTFSAVGRATSISAIRCARCRWLRSTRSSTKSRRGRPTSASCRSRTPPKARSTTRSTASCSPLKICGEVELRMHQQPDGAHDGAWSRCCASARIRSRWRSAVAGCDENLPGVDRACRSAAMPRGRAARATRPARRPSPAQTAAEVYGLTEAGAADIEDRPDNTTRFLVVGRKTAATQRRDKTTPAGVASERDQRLRCAAPPARAARAARQVNMTRIESRPSRKRKWDYVFFIDLIGHAEDAHVARALAQLKQRASLFRVLGSYPQAIL
jgi:chorismate mutase/prephenate dehydratase